MQSSLNACLISISTVVTPHILRIFYNLLVEMEEAANVIAGNNAAAAAEPHSLTSGSTAFLPGLG